MKRFVCFTLVCAICISLVACSKKPEKLFDQIISDIDEINQLREGPIYKEDEIDKIWDRTYKKLKKFGIVVNLTDNIEPAPIDEIFVETYLQSHTKDEFLSNTIKLYTFMRDKSNFNYYSNWKIDSEHWHFITTDECSCQTLSNLLELALAANDISTEGFDPNMKGTSGYYTENPNAEPLPFEEEHTGRFYNSDGTNGHDQTKTDTGVVEYYGDYAILSVTRHSYNDGYYGWVNGQFIDRTPYWSEVHNYVLYYKGTRVSSSDTKEELLNSNYSIINFDGEDYEIIHRVVDTYDAYDDYVETHTFLDIKKNEHMAG